MTMRGKDRAALRSEANGLQASVHVGHQGLAPNVIQMLDDSLRTRELVKVQLSKHSDKTPKVLAGELAAATASDVVQVIGRTATFYRENPEIERKDGTPPWRR
ncbi:MAG: YhbY family RNA-binding protein [Gemmatimonadetes bacterium]|nr:YhbY family RNA-binding protein [Gemmatimonadota bacterium]